jgi:hypothetical protein
VSLSHTAISWTAPENKIQICSRITGVYSHTFYMCLRFERKYWISVRDTAYPNRKNLVASGNVHIQPSNSIYPTGHKVTFIFAVITRCSQAYVKHMARSTADHVLSCIYSPFVWRYSILFINGNWMDSWRYFHSLIPSSKDDFGLLAQCLVAENLLEYLHDITWPSKSLTKQLIAEFRKQRPLGQ